LLLEARISLAPNQESKSILP